jgi:hypothetical protein
VSGRAPDRFTHHASRFGVGSANDAELAAEGREGLAVGRDGGRRQGEEVAPLRGLLQKQEAFDARPVEDPALADPERQDVIGESPEPPVFLQGIDVTFILEGA